MASPTLGDEQYRPLVHFTPERNWMNDPNGMVFHKGVYHLYFQHNPQGDRWGNMSWGHATSTDLLTWTEQPLAIPQTFDDQGRPIESIFSGSVVVDENNTSGFGDGTNAPLVAIYTSAYEPAHPTRAGCRRSRSRTASTTVTRGRSSRGTPCSIATRRTSATRRCSGTTDPPARTG